MKRLILGIVFSLAFATAAAASEAWVLNIPVRGNAQQETGMVKIWMGLNAAPQGAQLVVNSTTTLNLGDTKTVAGDSVSFAAGSGNQVLITYEPLSNFGADFCAGGGAVAKNIPMRFSGAQDVTDFRMASYIVAAPAVECSQPSKHTGDTPATIAPMADNAAPALNAVDKGRNTFDVGLVLDKSGSMADLPPGAAAGANKEGILQSAVQAFVGNWEQIDQPFGTGEWSQDRLALVFFDSTAKAQVLAGADPPANVFLERGNASAWDTVISATNALVPGLNTSIGGGINEAMKQWKADSMNDLTLIVVTDGMQNTPPLILPTASGFLGLDPVANLPQELRKRFIPIQTVAFGQPAQIDETLLKNISLETDGISYQDINATSMFNTFAMTLVAILKGNSVSIGARETVTIPAIQPTPAKTVYVDSSAGRVVFSLQWAPPLKDALELQVFKPGAVPGSPPATPFSTKKLPQADIQTFNVGSGDTGAWTVRIRPNPRLRLRGSIPHALNVFFLERHLDFDFSLIKPLAAAGEPIGIRAVVDWDHRPLAGLPPGTIRARVLGPSEPLGTVLHNTNIETVPKSGEVMTPYQQKVASIRPIPLKEVGTVTLREAGKGVYSGTFEDTKVPGEYAFEPVIDFEREGMGHVHREERIEQIVRVKADPAQTEITRTKGPTAGTVLIGVTPRDRFGNYLGPGYASVIRAKVTSGGKLRTEVPVDRQQTGTYIFEIGEVPVDTVPAVEIAVDGVVVSSPPK